MAQDITLDPAEVKTELGRISDQLKEHGEKAVAEATKAIGMSTWAKQQVDELLTKQNTLVQENAAMKARLLEVEQKADRRGGEGEPVVHSAGHELTESESFKSYVAGHDYSKGYTFQTKAIVNVTSDPASAGVLIEAQRIPGIVAPPNPQFRVRDLLTPGTTNSNRIDYVRESGFQNMAATVAEGALKPQSDLTFDSLSTNVVKIATWVKASTEILEDAPMLRSYIDGRLRFMLAFKEDAQLLKGSGVGNNLNGIYTQASAYVPPITIPDATDIDTLRLAMLQGELAEYPSTGIVLHPSNWARIELTKDNSGGYLFANPQALAAQTLWRLPVVTTKSMTQGTFLVGAFRLGAQIFDRRQANVTISTENQDDFIKNLVTILAEERLGLAVYRPEAFVKGALAA